MKLSNFINYCSSDARTSPRQLAGRRIKNIVFKPIFWLLTIFLVFHLYTATHYGLTWDEPAHLTSGIIDLKNWTGQKIPFLPDTLAYGPVAETLGALSYLLFFQTLHLLLFDVAFHLPIVLLGVLGIYLVYLFGKDFISEKVGFWSAFFLSLMPRCLGHLHNNIKDIPLAVLFSLAVYLFTKAFFTPPRCEKKKILLATVAAGLALAQKINALEIFPIMGIPLLFTSWGRKKNNITIKIKPLLLLFLSFIFTLVIAFLLWPRLWSNPIDQLQNIISHFATTWKGNSVPFFGKLYLAGINVPWTYALSFIAITTPIYILGFGIIGMIKVVAEILRKNSTFLYVMLLVWFFLPTLKYLVPSIVIYDDIRQYMETIFPLVIFAGIGVETFLNRLLYYCSRLKVDNYVLNFSLRSKNNLTVFILILLFVSHFIYVEKNYHPYETSYFNVLVGGLKGANQQMFDADFWANPVKEASLWLNKVAPLKSRINTPLAGNIADFYLRKDLKRLTGKDDIYNADYVVLLNRPSVFWLNNNIYSFMYSHQPIYTIQRDQTPLLFVYRK